MERILVGERDGQGRQESMGSWGKICSAIYIRSTDRFHSDSLLSLKDLSTFFNYKKKFCSTSNMILLWDFFYRFIYSHYNIKNFNEF